MHLRMRKRTRSASSGFTSCQNWWGMKSCEASPKLAVETLVMRVARFMLVTNIACSIRATSNTGYVRGPAMLCRLGRSQAVHTHGKPVKTRHSFCVRHAQQASRTAGEAYRQSKLRETEHRRLRGAVMAEKQLRSHESTLTT